MDKIAIYGAGGAAKDVLTIVRDMYPMVDLAQHMVFAEDDQYFKSREIHGIKVIPLSAVNFDEYKIAIAMGDFHSRKKAIGNLPLQAKFATLIHPSATIGQMVKIGRGAIIAQHVTITIDVEIGDYCLLNTHTAIAHDCKIGHFFTTAPGVKVNGTCIIGDNVYIGSNACIKNKTKITDNAIIGMGAVVVRDILEEGVYIGCPAKKQIK